MSAYDPKRTFKSCDVMIMKGSKIILVSLFVLYLTGCSSIKDISNVTPYNKIVGTQKVLARDTLVCIDELTISSTKQSVLYGLRERYIQRDGKKYSRDCLDSETLTTLPAGHIVYISKVEMHSIASVKPVKKLYAMGNLELENGKSIKFYQWLGSPGFIHKASWEE